MRVAVARGLGGWDETYPVASAEDVDLAFKTWVNDLDIVFDERVLVEHVHGASARLLGDWRARWDQNRRLFLDRWQDPALDVPRLARCDPDRFARNRAIAAATAEWMDRYFSAQRSSWMGRRGLRRLQARIEGVLRRAWSRVEISAPPSVAGAARRLRRRLRT